MGRRTSRSIKDTIDGKSITTTTTKSETTKDEGEGLNSWLESVAVASNNGRNVSSKINGGTSIQSTTEKTPYCSPPTNRVRRSRRRLSCNNRSSLKEQSPSLSSTSSLSYSQKYQKVKKENEGTDTYSEGLDPWLGREVVTDNSLQNLPSDSGHGSVMSKMSAPASTYLVSQVSGVRHCRRG